MKYYIYTITNTVSDKVYVGVTSLPDNRFANHISKLKKCKHENKLLQSDFNKVGFDHLSFAVVKTMECSKKQAHQEEIDWINAYPQVYNILKRLSTKTNIDVSKAEAVKYSFCPQESRTRRRTRLTNTWGQKWLATQTVQSIDAYRAAITYYKSSKVCLSDVSEIFGVEPVRLRSFCDGKHLDWLE